jgi:hypothetical protein
LMEAYGLTPAKIVEAAQKAHSRKQATVSNGKRS